MSRTEFRRPIVSIIKNYLASHTSRKHVDKQLKNIFVANIQAYLDQHLLQDTKYNKM
jgi:hypothetical protein